MAETSYAKCGDLSLAYQVFGDGPVELVFVGPIVTHVELFWAMPEFKAFFDQLATFCRVLLFDKAGVGLSDPIPKVRLLEERAAEIEAVMDAAGFGKAVLFAMSEGGPQAIVFAARRPERTRALIIYGSSRPCPAPAGTTWIATRPSCGRASLPSWVRSTRRRRSRSPATRNSSAAPSRRGAAVQQPR
jgi:pimeloyl-ACP methyl ester carboxylesterase